jgi:hypothetical protein
MINKINKERRHSMNATPPDPATRASGKEPRRTPNKNSTGHKANQSFIKMIFVLLCPNCYKNNKKIIHQIIKMKPLNNL